ncbi:DMT family transporter [Candidatus Micrarchaeota archaeon]|nr:DMT family transporter [Candidatus Micrarchaeota archaeon]
MKLNPFAEAILAGIIFGSSGAFVKYLNLPPTTISFFRLAVPTLILLAFFAVKKTRLFRGDNKLMLIASTINAARIFLYFIGFTYASIANAVIVLYTWPIFATILGGIALKEKIDKKTILALAVAFAGIAFAYWGKQFSFADKDFLGMTAIILSSLGYAVTFIIYKKESKKYSNLETVFYQNVVGAIVFLPFLFINSPFPTIGQIGVSVFYAALIGLVAFALVFSALKKLKASTTAILSYLEVVSAIILGVLLFNESITWNMAVGGFLILSSTLFLTKKSD